jgi:hypothetical protein
MTTDNDVREYDAALTALHDLLLLMAQHAHHRPHHAGNYPQARNARLQSSMDVIGQAEVAEPSLCPPHSAGCRARHTDAIGRSIHDATGVAAAAAFAAADSMAASHACPGAAVPAPLQGDDYLVEARLHHGGARRQWVSKLSSPI